MARSFALVGHDPVAGAYGLVVPDFPGCNAMGMTFEEDEANGIEALREWAVDRLADAGELPHARSIGDLRQDASLREDFTPGGVAVSLPVDLDSARPVRANVSTEGGLLAEIDEAARRRGLVCSAFLASAAREKIAAGRRLVGS